MTTAKPPALGICLTLPAPGMSREFILKRRGEILAASDGDEVLLRPGHALMAAFELAKANQRSEEEDL